MRSAHRQTTPLDRHESRYRQRVAIWRTFVSRERQGVDEYPGYPSRRTAHTSFAPQRTYPRDGGGQACRHRSRVRVSAGRPDTVRRTPSRTHELTNSRTHELTNSQTHDELRRRTTVRGLTNHPCLSTPRLIKSHHYYLDRRIRSSRRDQSDRCPSHSATSPVGGRNLSSQVRQLVVSGFCASGGGSLIHAMVGSSGGVGRRLKRSGCAV